MQLWQLFTVLNTLLNFHKSLKDLKLNQMKKMKKIIAKEIPQNMVLINLTNDKGSISIEKQKMK